MVLEFDEVDLERLRSAVAVSTSATTYCRTISHRSGYRPRQTMGSFLLQHTNTLWRSTVSLRAPVYISAIEQ